MKQYVKNQVSALLTVFALVLALLTGCAEQGKNDSSLPLPPSEDTDVMISDDEAAVKEVAPVEEAAKESADSGAPAAEEKKETTAKEKPADTEVPKKDIAPATDSQAVLSEVATTEGNTVTIDCGDIDANALLNQLLCADCEGVLNTCLNEGSCALLDQLCGNCNEQILDCVGADCENGKVEIVLPSLPSADEESANETSKAPVTTPSANATQPPVTTEQAPESTEQAPATTPAAPEAENTASAVSDYEREVVDLVNDIRRQYGLNELTLNEELSAVAREKSADMQRNGYFSHTSPTYGSPFAMMKQFGISYQSAGENIAMGYPTPAEVVEGWMNSEGHRENILKSSFTEIGVGYVANGHYWTQMFIG